MFSRVFLTGLLILTGAVFAQDEDDIKVTIKGTLHGDKFGYFVQANGGVFDLVFSAAGKADMQRFHNELKGDLVQVQGTLYIDDDGGKGKARLTVYANDITRVKRVVVTERREVVTTPPPVVVRETYVEPRPRHGVDLPGVHIHW